MEFKTMTHLVLKLHVTLPDFTLLVSLGNFGEEGIEHEVMVLNSIADGKILREVGPMKELERMYIAYLNKEGSDPIKWTMIEFCILNSLETAQVEQNKRRMRGIYVKPETGVAGSYLNASTGIIYTLVRYMLEAV